MPPLTSPLTLQRLLDPRHTRLRLLLAISAGVGFLLVRPGGGPPTSLADWGYALGCFALYLGWERWPLAVTIAEAALFAVAEYFTDAGGVVVEVGATWALFELAMCRVGWPVLVGATALAVARVLERGPTLWVVFEITVLVCVPALIGAYIRGTRELAEQAQQRAVEEQRRRRSETLAARAAERTTIARELHDLVAHHVSSMVLRVAVARRVADPTPAVGKVLDDIHTSGTAALADLRRLVAVLRDPETVRDDAALALVDPAALPDALETVVERARAVGLTVAATIDPELSTLDAVRGLAVLRLVQEGLANVARHAGSGASAALSVALEADTVRLELRDSGGTGALVEVGGEPGHGLVGMRERVELLGGSFNAGAADSGWLLAATLPPNGDL